MESKKVLIVDDDPDMGAELKLHLDRYQNGITFHTEIALNPEELYEKLKDSKLHDAIVVDRKFKAKYFALSILRALNDLRVDCLRIIWTAHPEDENMKQCFRLGAYDYIPKSKDCYKTVLNSILSGLEVRRKLHEKEKTDLLAHKYIREYYPTIFSEYKGQYLALKQIDEKENNWEILASDNILTRLYYELEMKSSDEDILHLTFIQE